MNSRATFEHRTVDELRIGDERSFRHVALYADLKEILRRARYRFQILPRTRPARADRALLLNLTFWAAGAGGDVLVDEHVEADVIAHAAWHHLAARALMPGPPRGSGQARRPSASALFLGESIASAFDVYLVGRALGHAPRSSFLQTQVPAMADATAAAGLSRSGFQKLLADLVARPERAFTELRALLYDATSALFASRSSEEGLAVLAALEGRRFSALLPRYELSNWVLYARAYAATRTADARVDVVDRALRISGRALDWLEQHWVAPALTRP
jgi:hypothetical protein